MESNTFSTSVFIAVPPKTVYQLSLPPKKSG